MNGEAEITISPQEHANIGERLGREPIHLAASASRLGGRVRGVSRQGAGYLASIEPGPVPTTMTAAPTTAAPTKKDPAIVEKLRGTGKEGDPHGTALLARAVMAHRGCSFVEALGIVSERKGAK